MLTQKSVSKKREGADGWVAAQQRQAGRRGLGSRLPGGGGRWAWEEAHGHLLPDLSWSC